MERRIDFHPASDTRSHDNPHGSVRGCRLVFIVEGPRGRAEFEVQTNWHTKRGQAQFFGIGNWKMLLPFGRSLTVTAFEGTEGPAVADDTLIDAMFDTMVERGEEAVFEALERLYRRTFGFGDEAVIEAEVVAHDPVSPKLLP